MFEFKNNLPFVIAEIGQNHQGSFDLAKKYVEVYSGSGATCVKFQRRNNKALFSESALQKPYDNKNSFGKTYGEHREHLELSFDELKELRKISRRLGCYFMVTPFDEASLEECLALEVDLLKIASFDLGNLPFIDKIRNAALPVVISTGGGNDDEIAVSVKHLSEKVSELAVLHCVSEYPCEFDKLSLNRIRELICSFPDAVVGISDHFNGILSGPLAYTAGARIFEKHVTLDRSSKGTDHSFALEPNGFSKFVRDIRRTPSMFEIKKNEKLGKEPVFQKLGKSLVYSRLLKRGEPVRICDLSGVIFDKPIVPVRRSREVIGRTLKIDVEVGQPVSFAHFQDDGR